jgi:mannose-6-phosphate isomerase
MSLPPLRFRPILKPRAWGGSGLRAFGKHVSAGVAVGESWEIADLAPPVEDGVSRVQGGSFDGTTLSALLENHGKAILGRMAAVAGRFPLLVKYLDAADNLSVQVHPTAAYAKAHPGAHLKTEAWVVLHAAPGAAIYRGVRGDVTAEGFRAALAGGAGGAGVLPLLVREPVAAGDCVPLESGLCHALGAGVLVAEVQTPSDTTFRVWDWDRGDPGRPLHVEQAMDCILFGKAQKLDEQRVTNLDRAGALWSDGLRAAVVCRTAFFEIELVEASPSGDAGTLTFEAADGPEVLMLGRGEAVMEAEGHRAEHLSAGDTVLLPAARVKTTVDLSPGAMLMRASMADAGRNVRDGMRAGEREA